MNHQFLLGLANRPQLNSPSPSIHSTQEKAGDFSRPELPYLKHHITIHTPSRKQP
jgi:hypothetical protein